ncbi:helix-turn-helix transcriptional regulator [Brenneria sp. MC1SB4.1]|uniref:Helix-turn-helix transcriptional regulator n=2 Tax=Brenneria tiliae TaxID=2914984 RepID=A0ABT0MSN2_9GAMM|nr:helix-turn-helix transcriptional regulator [Brenneria tiliae]MCL2892845.1 helix-turn-helix transcriptional regulator [Brenneria tiliae]
MIRCHLARMMGEHKMRIADVARETGLSRATITLLYKETAQKVDLDALEKLCDLFNCSIGDMLERTIGPKPDGMSGSVPNSGGMR